MKLSVLGLGLTFGDTDILAARPYKASLKCVSQQGTVLIIQKDEFLRIFRTENESWKVEFELARTREKNEILALETF